MCCAIACYNLQILHHKTPSVIIIQTWTRQYSSASLFASCMTDYYCHSNLRRRHSALFWHLSAIFVIGTMDWWLNIKNVCVRERDGKTACTSVVVDKVRFSEWYRDFHACKWLVGGSTCQIWKEILLVVFCWHQNSQLFFSGTFFRSFFS